MKSNWESLDENQMLVLLLDMKSKCESLDVNQMLVLLIDMKSKGESFDENKMLVLILDDDALVQMLLSLLDDYGDMVLASGQLVETNGNIPVSAVNHFQSERPDAQKSHSSSKLSSWSSCIMPGLRDSWKGIHNYRGTSSYQSEMAEIVSCAGGIQAHSFPTGHLVSEPEDDSKEGGHNHPGKYI